MKSIFVKRLNGGRGTQSKHLDPVSVYLWTRWEAYNVATRCSTGREMRLVEGN